MITRALLSALCVLSTNFALAQAPPALGGIASGTGGFSDLAQPRLSDRAKNNGQPLGLPNPSQAGSLGTSGSPQPAIVAPGYYGSYAEPYGVVYAQPQPTEEEQKLTQEFGAAVAQLREAKTAEDKASARKKLGELLDAQLERDLKQRETKLAEIEQRAKELREQLDQRRNSKTEIQKMLMLLIENPQSGLGLPPTWMNTLVPHPQVYQGYPNMPLPAGYSTPAGANTTPYNTRS